MKNLYTSQQRVDIETAKQRALDYLKSQAGRPVLASWVADAIWPDHQMQSQGAGFAASAILSRLDVDGTVRWVSREHERGWVAT